MTALWIGIATSDNFQTLVWLLHTHTHQSYIYIYTCTYILLTFLPHFLWLGPHPSVSVHPFMYSQNCAPGLVYQVWSGHWLLLLPHCASSDDLLHPHCLPHLPTARSHPGEGTRDFLQKSRWAIIFSPEGKWAVYEVLKRKLNTGASPKLKY